MSHNSKQIQIISQTLYNSIRNLDYQEFINPDKLAEFQQQHFKPLYPHKELGEHQRKFFCCEACSSSPGSFCCGSSKPGDSDFVKFGLSICLYFNFLKHSSYFLVLVSTLAILSCVVCYFVAMQNGINPMDSYSKFLFSTTYGSFSSEHNKCKYSLLTNINATYSTSFNIKCHTGYINLFGPSFSSQSLSSLYNCKNERRKLSSKIDSPSQYVLNSSLNCDSTVTECNISMIFKPNIATIYKTVAYTYECLSSSYEIGSIYAKSEIYFLSVFLADFFIFLIFLVFMVSEAFAEEKATFFFENQVSLSDYSIWIKGFTTKTAEKELQAMLNLIEIKNRDIALSIVSFTFQQNEKMYELYQERQKAIRAIAELIEIYYFYEEENRRLTFRECHERVFNLNDEAKAARYKEYSKELSNMMNQIIRLERAIIKIENQSNEKVSCYLVFNQTKMIKQIKAMADTKCSDCCCNNNLYVNEEVYKIESPPVPDMILRQNSFSWTKLRVFISWIFTIVICVGSYLLFGFIQYKQAEMNSTYKYDIDCNVLYTSTQLTTIDSTLLSQANYVSCICKSKSLLDSFSLNSEYCSTWQRQYVLYLTIPLLISLGIVAYNILASYIFQFMSKLERHKTVINEQVSYTFKRAFQLIMNMGLIVILLNYNYKNQTYLSQMSFIYLGKFDDFALHSYENIGAIIILTMIFNIATPFAEFMLTVIKKGIKKCLDTRCGSVPTSKKTKSEYIEYYNDTIFRIEQRYAYLIATFFITFAFCGVIPILIPILVISLIFLYFLDKILIFKFYQTPIIYTQTLHKIFVKVLLVSFIAHLSLTAYFLSQPTLIAANNRATTQIVSDNTRINNIITTIFIYPYIGLLAIVLVFLFLRICCRALAAAFQCCCRRDYRSEEDAMTNQIQFWGVLSQIQVNNLYKVLQYTKERFMRNTQGVGASQHQVLKSAQILEATVERLKKQRERKYERRAMIDSAELIGLPSYEYMMKSDKLSANAMMMKIEQQLTTFYSQRLSRNMEHQTSNRTSDRLYIQQQLV